MSYRAGVYGLERLGIPSGPPRITCDSCGATRSPYRNGTTAPAAWFLDGRAAPGWSLIRRGEERIDTCPECRKRARPGTESAR